MRLAAGRRRRGCRDNIQTLDILTIPDPGHSQNERRVVSLGRSARERLLVVVHTDRAGTVRIISARSATPREKRHHGSHA
jgi:uncharacterized DUF497 family protein